MCFRCVEVGSGSGYISCSIALLLQQLGIAAHCISTDINPAAVSATACTLQAHNVRLHRADCVMHHDPLKHCRFHSSKYAYQVLSKVDLIRSDLLQGLRARLHRAVDLLVCFDVSCPHKNLKRRGMIVLDKSFSLVSTSSHDASRDDVRVLAFSSGVQSALCAHAR